MTLAGVLHWRDIRPDRQYVVVIRLGRWAGHVYATRTVRLARFSSSGVAAWACRGYASALTWEAHGNQPEAATHLLYLAESDVTGRVVDVWEILE